MTTQGPYESIPGLLATGDLSSQQYKIVKLSTATAGSVKVSAAATDDSIGVLQNDPVNGQPAVVATGGVTKVLAEASVTIGAWVASSTTGRAKVTTTANDNVVGMALDASSSAGDLIRVLLKQHNL